MIRGNRLVLFFQSTSAFCRLLSIFNAFFVILCTDIAFIFDEKCSTTEARGVKNLCPLCLSLVFLVVKEHKGHKALRGLCVLSGKRTQRPQGITRSLCA
jgi:hypothetical protein